MNTESPAAFYGRAFCVHGGFGLPESVAEFSVLRQARDQ